MRLFLLFAILFTPVLAFAQALTGTGGGSSDAAVGRLQGQITQLENLVRTMMRENQQMLRCQSQGLFYRPGIEAADKDGCADNAVDRRLVGKLCPDQHFVAGFDGNGSILCRRAIPEPRPRLLVSHIAAPQCGLVIATTPLPESCRDGDVQNIRESAATEYSNPACEAAGCCPAFNIDLRCVENRWSVLRTYSIAQNGISSPTGDNVWARVEYRR